MIADRIEGKWIDAFREVLEACGVQRGEVAAILSETQSRALNVHLAELALHQLGARPYHIVVPTPRNPHPVPVRSTGASEAIGGLAPVVTALASAGIVVDLTIEGLMHARETPAILGGGARILTISNEHPEGAGAVPPGPGARNHRPRRHARHPGRGGDAGDIGGGNGPHGGFARAPIRSASGAGPRGPARSRIGRAGWWSPSPRPAP